MGKKLNRIIARTLKEAKVSETKLSEEAGYYRSSFSRFKQGIRNATPEAAHALADTLRKRAKRLKELADELDRAAGPRKEG